MSGGRVSRVVVGVVAVTLLCACSVVSAGASSQSMVVAVDAPATFPPVQGISASAEWTATEAPPGSTVGVIGMFEAVSPDGGPYTVGVHVIDSAQITQFPVTGNLTYCHTVEPNPWVDCSWNPAPGEQARLELTVVLSTSIVLPTVEADVTIRDRPAAFSTIPTGAKLPGTGSSALPIHLGLAIVTAGVGLTVFSRR
jgi:hypothetical protein